MQIEFAPKPHQNERQSLLIEQKELNSNGSHKRWSTKQLILVVLLTIIVSNVLSNIDRMIEYISDGMKSNDDNSSDDKDKYYYDAVIVGGGATGLHTMHFLSMDNDINSKYTKLLIERLPRVGGNAFSHSLKYNETTIIFELGAMRFRPNNYYISRMLKRMDLCDEYISMDSTESNKNRYYYYRNEWNLITNATDQNYWFKLYNFHPIEMQQMTDNFDADNRAYQQILDENNNGSAPNNANEWSQFRNEWTLKGVKLEDWPYESYWKWYQNYSLELYDYAEDRAPGFRRDQDLASYLFDRYGPNLYPDPAPTEATNNLTTLKKGYMELSRRLLNNITKYGNNNIWLGHEVYAIDYSERDEKRYKYKISVNNLYPNEEEALIRYVYTNRIILGMNANALQTQLPYFKPIDNEETRYLVNSVTVASNYKVNLIFDSWFVADPDKDFIKSASGSLTNLAIRTFLIESVWTNGSLTTLQIFAQGDRADLLHRLQSMGNPYPMHEGVDVDLSDGLLLATEPLVDEILKELRLIVAKKQWTIPKPIAAFAQPMGKNVSNGDGIYRMKYGHNRDYVLENIVHPTKSENIYIGCSSFSPWGIWHWGAMWSAIRLVQKSFNVSYNPLEFDEYCTF